MSDIMDADLFDAARLAAADHLVIEIILCDLEDPVIRMHLIKLPQIILHLLAEKLRHLDRPVAFGRFRARNDILALHPVIGLADRDCLRFEIEVRRCKRQQLGFPDPGPVEHEDMYDFRIANIDDFRI